MYLPQYLPLWQNKTKALAIAICRFAELRKQKQVLIKRFVSPLFHFHFISLPFIPVNVKQQKLLESREYFQRTMGLLNKASQILI